MNFHEENSDVRKVVFSTFCTFRPKECITGNNSSSHYFRVYHYHQNAKLRVAAVNKSLSYKDFMALLVCDITNEEYMLKQCGDCP